MRADSTDAVLDETGAPQEHRRRWIMFRYTPLYIAILRLLIAIVVLRKPYPLPLYIEMTDRNPPVQIIASIWNARRMKRALGVCRCARDRAL